jgi:hypothetical protein
MARSRVVFSKALVRLARLCSDSRPLVGNIATIEENAERAREIGVNYLSGGERSETGTTVRNCSRTFDKETFTLALFLLQVANGYKMHRASKEVDMYMRHKHVKRLDKLYV